VLKTIADAKKEHDGNAELRTHIIKFKKLLEVGSKIDIDASKKQPKEEEDGYLVKIVEEAKQEAELKQGELTRKVLEETGKKKSGTLKKN